MHLSCDHCCWCQRRKITRWNTVLSTSGIYYVLIAIERAKIWSRCSVLSLWAWTVEGNEFDIVVFSATSSCLTLSLTHGGIISERRSIIVSIPGHGDSEAWDGAHLILCRVYVIRVIWWKYKLMGMCLCRSVGFYKFVMIAVRMEISHIVIFFGVQWHKMNIYAQLTFNINYCLFT